MGGSPTVYVARRGGRFEPREVETGLDNNRMIHIVSGLEPGDRVWLAPPLEEAEVTENGGLPEGMLNGETPVVPAAPSPPAGAARDEGRRGGDRPEVGDEQRERMRQMTPEQREAMRKRRQEGGGQQP